MNGFDGSHLSIPQVTDDDLHYFHETHFGHAAGHHAACVVVDNADDGDDGLGYYPDGVKRTLTDEQIAMFRHSEIQVLLRERRQARENSPSDHSSSGKSPESVEQPKAAPPNGSKASSDSKRKWEQFIDEDDENPELLTHRRLARELDEQRAASLSIDYGDDPLPEKVRSKIPASATKYRRVAAPLDTKSPSTPKASKPSFKWPTLGAGSPLDQS